MLRFLSPGLLCIVLACSGSDEPNVSEAPQPSLREDDQVNSETYVLDKKDGLEVEVLVEGNGKTVYAGDHVTVHYRGMVVENEFVFGNTFKAGVPLKISLVKGGAIEGWRRGLVGLGVGSKVILRVPSELAYGEAGMPSSKIPTNADLQYEIEVLDTADRRKR